MAANFNKYSTFYDLLYRDKSYAEEADYVARTIRSVAPAATSILELGSGTGRHGHILAAAGFDVHGIERSADMVSVARAAELVSSVNCAGSFTCEVGDIRSISLDRTFDAVISLFHVVSYQTTDKCLEAAFRVAAHHLVPGGAFLFDVWHGPAVLAQKPQTRVKQVADERHSVRRTARPDLNLKTNTVKVTYQMECTDLQTGELIRFSEDHMMRYLFPADVERLAAGCGLRCVRSEEFLTGAPPSPSTWGVVYLLLR